MRLQSILPPRDQTGTPSNEEIGETNIRLIINVIHCSLHSDRINSFLCNLGPYETPVYLVNHDIIMYCYITKNIVIKEHNQTLLFPPAWKVSYNETKKRTIRIEPYTWQQMCS